MHVVLTQRQLKIIHLLYIIREFVTVNHIAKELSCSEKTIRNEIKKINIILLNQKIGNIKTKTNKGVFFDISIENYEKLSMNTIRYSVFDDNHKLNLVFNILQKKQIDIQTLSYLMCLDKITLKNQLPWVKDWFESHHIMLVINEDVIKLSCYSEINYLKAYWHLFNTIPKETIIEHNLLPTFKPQIYKDIDERDLFMFLTFFKTEMDYFYEIYLNLKATEANLTISFNYQSFIWLIFNFLYILKYPILIKGWETENMENNLAIPHYIKSIFPKNQSLNNLQLEHLTRCFHVAEISKIYHSRTPLSFFYLINLRTKIKTFISSISYIIGVDMRRNEQLINDLIIIISPIIHQNLYQLNPNIQYSNNMLQKVKQTYLELALSVEFNIDILEKFYHFKFNQYQIALITLCIRNISSSKQSQVKIAIIIDKYKSIAEFIANKIKRYISQIEIIDFISVRELYTNRPYNFDILISTTNIPKKIRDKITEQHKYLIYVDEILLPYDINLIKKFISKFRKEKKRDLNLLEKNLGYDWFYLFSEEKFLYVNDSNKTKQEVLTFLFEQLYQNNYVENYYLDSIVQRENFSSTYIGNSIALTHGEPQYVKKDAISIYYSNNPICWDNENNANLIVLLSLKKSKKGIIDHRFSSFYTIIAKLSDNKLLQDEINNCKTPQDLYQFIKSLPRRLLFNQLDVNV